MPARTHTDLADKLQSIYGPTCAQHTERYANALARFDHLYGPGPVEIMRAPGRVNIIGEHTDYNHGFVLPAALDKDIVLLARRRTDQHVRAANIEPQFATAEFELGPDIPPAATGDWSNYLRGPAQYIAAIPDSAVTGLDILIDGAPPLGVPRSAGLSSSSALVVAMALALSHFSNWHITGAAFAHACADAEWYVGTRGGIMDHFAAILTQQNHALFLDCRPAADGAFQFEHIPFPPGYRLLVVDSGVHHDNVRGAYNRRVAACRAGVALLRQQRVTGNQPLTHLRDVQEIAWTALEPHLPDTVTLDSLRHKGIDLGELPGVADDTPLAVRACCRHVWHENARVLATLAALRRNDIAAVGQLLNESHVSMRDDYDISTPELDFLVAAANEVDGVAGARLTGAGWGGCIVILAAADAVDDLQQHIARSYERAYGRQPNQFLCQAGPGAGHVATLQR